MSFKRDFSFLFYLLSPFRLIFNELIKINVIKKHVRQYLKYFQFCLPATAK